MCRRGEWPPPARPASHRDRDGHGHGPSHGDVTRSLRPPATHRPGDRDLQVSPRHALTVGDSPRPLAAAAYLPVVSSESESDPAVTVPLSGTVTAGP
jgi:hypothetical protein